MNMDMVVDPDQRRRISCECGCRGLRRQQHRSRDAAGGTQQAADHRGVPLNSVRCQNSIDAQM